MIHLLEKKFEVLSTELLCRINQADEKQILQWSEYVLTADKLSDIFGN